MTGCRTETRTVTVSFNFEVCVDHGHAAPADGSFQSDGVPPEDAIKGIMSVVEQIMAQFMGQSEELQAMLAKDYGDFTLNERAQFRLIRLLANHLMAQQVAARNYFTSGHSALLAIPREGVGGDGPADP